MKSDDTKVVDFSTASPQKDDDEITLVETLVNIKKSATKDKGIRQHWKIIRVGNITEVHQFFVDIIKAFDREDLVKLYSLVKERVHHISSRDGQDIFMLVEKEYPLSRGALLMMLVQKLQVDEHNKMAEELLRKIFMQAERLRNTKSLAVLSILALLTLQQTKVGNITKVHHFFVDLIKDFDREDLVKLWSLVMERFSSSDLTEDKEIALWVKLKRLCKPDVDDELWKFESFELIWRLYDWMECIIYLQEMDMISSSRRKRVSIVKMSPSDDVDSKAGDGSSKEGKSLKRPAEEELRQEHQKKQKVKEDLSQEREDLVKLWSLVMERFSSSDLTEDKEIALCVKLKRLCKPDFTLDYDSQMIDKYFAEYTIIEVKQFKETLLQHTGNVMKYVAERTPIDDDLVIKESSETESEVQDDSSKPGNDTDVDDVNIRPIYDKELMAKVQLTAKWNIFAIGQHHTKQPEIINEGRVDQYTEESDHAGYLDLRKCTSGGIQFLGGDKLVSWSSKKHDCTSMSSAEAG
nr:Gag-Pol polyprotein [Tanacetum cinerariifolium]